MNLQALIGLIELPFFFVYLLSAWLLVEWIVGIIVLLPFFCYLAANIWMFWVFREKTVKDPEFKVWS